jgi:predicted dehydrogenase
VCSVRIGIVGASGFAATHIKSALNCQEKGLCELAAVVIRLPYRSGRGKEDRERELRERGIRIYRDYQDMLSAEKNKLDLVTIPVGISLHADISIDSLRAGYHVLCEKPAAGSFRDAVRMLEAQRNTGKILSIGYQYLLTGGIQSTKRLALSRQYGRLLKARSIVQWPRDSLYFNRNEWAGKLRVDGRPVYDSPMQNAAAHFLQHMLYVAGDTADSNAYSAEVYAENYRANNIESADTQFIRIVTDTDVTVTFVASHALREEADPYSEFEFEEATLAWDPRDGARMLTNRGSAAESTAVTAEDLNPPNREFEGFNTNDFPFVDVAHALTEVRPPKCSISNSIQHVLCVESAFAASEGIHEIERSYREVIPHQNVAADADVQETPTLTAVRDLEKVLSESFRKELGPAELQVPWGRAGTKVRPDLALRPDRG